jgi:tetratricopeptide (TPR) repeat protein
MTNGMLSAGGKYAIIVLLAVLTIAGSGCRRDEVAGEMEAFLDQYGELPAEVKQDSLRAVGSRSGRNAVFAHYELGNMFYNAATESAQTSGWNDDLALGLLDSAQFRFEQAVALDSTFVPALVNLGSLWDDKADQVGSGQNARQLREERLVEARRLYEKALEVDPTDEKAGCNLASLWLKKRQHNLAMDQLRKVLEFHPDSPLAHYNLAIMFAEEKMYREAIVEWEKASAADPEGDIGERSRENIKIVQDLITAKVPENLGGE